jgi:uncharacterized protein (TIGR03083 family)
MEIAEHITAVGQEAKLFAQAAEEGGCEVNVPTCPGWTMRDLVRHLSEVHLWAAAHVAQPHDKPWVDDLAELAVFWPDLAVFWPDDKELTSSYLNINANLVDALESAPPDVEAFTFLPAPSPLAMWARRQAHETAIHRFDAQNAARIVSRFDPAFASDGIDELLAGFAPRGSRFTIDPRKAILVHAEDTNDRWHVTMSPDGITTQRGDGPADATLTGAAADLYLTLWNRGMDSQIRTTGDHTLLDKWHDNMRIRWS